MFYMLSAFDLKANYSLQDCQLALDRFSKELLDSDLVREVGPISHRARNTILDNDKDKDQNFLMLMGFNDELQAKHAISAMRRFSEVPATRHQHFYNMLENMVFLSWVDGETD